MGDETGEGANFWRGKNLFSGLSGGGGEWAAGEIIRERYLLQRGKTREIGGLYTYHEEMGKRKGHPCRIVIPNRLLRGRGGKKTHGKKEEKTILSMPAWKREAGTEEQRGKKGASKKKGSHPGQKKGGNIREKGVCDGRPREGMRKKKPKSLS